MKKFYLYTRKSKNNKIFYVQLLNPRTGKLMPGKSTGQTNREEAAYISMKWLKEGIPDGKTKTARKVEETFSVDELLNGLRVSELTETDVTRILAILKSRNLISDEKHEENSLTLIDFLMNFWDYENSEYIREKAAYGQNLTKNHCKDMIRQVKNHWMQYFSDKKLVDITKQDLKDFSFHLVKKKKTLQNKKKSDNTLKPATVNRVLSAGLTGLRWAFNNDLIHDDITKGLKRFSGISMRRGILSDTEVKELFTEGLWPSPASRLPTCQIKCHLSSEILYLS
ncbi:MAG: hypothetical protein JEY99_11670 [Spirochaetales bacterium]|nr:hypothetical protein [Spirochaetales bacterium]